MKAGCGLNLKGQNSVSCQSNTSYLMIKLEGLILELVTGAFRPAFGFFINIATLASSEAG
jgi:hypothetical protein